LPWGSDGLCDQRGGGSVTRGSYSVALLAEAQVEERQQVAADEAALIARLRAGDERAFDDVVTRFYPSMLAVARGYVRSRAVAEEVVQEAWVGVLNGLDRFEGRSSLRTWVLRIVANTAQTRGVREARVVPVSSLRSEGDEPAVERERFRGASDPFPGHWWSYPTDWRTVPESKLLSQETLDVVKDAIDELPELQRTVITMRDVAGCDSDEVCSTLEISEGNQRVLLHRARARVRSALERHLDA
jgi:RNA polymerase sigma-70 factor, ECF subfamily